MGGFKMSSLTRTAFSAAVIILSSLTAAASDWQHIQLAATNGVKISIDYQMLAQCVNFTRENRPHQARMANPVWFNVTGVNGNPSSVEVVIEFYKQDMIAHGSAQNPVIRTYDHFDRIVRLQRVVDQNKPQRLDQVRFTGDAGAVVTRVTSSSARSEERVFQRLQVKINGVPLIDPVNGTTFFGISMYDRVPCLNL